jgi:hypothetical protein
MERNRMGARVPTLRAVVVLFHRVPWVIVRSEPMLGDDRAAEPA